MTRGWLSDLERQAAQAGGKVGSAPLQEARPSMPGDQNPIVTAPTHGNPDDLEAPTPTPASQLGIDHQSESDHEDSRAVRIH